VELVLDMPVKLLESNPLVEETRNQTVVKRGPLVYCLEGIDVQGAKSIDNVLIPADIQFTVHIVILIAFLFVICLFDHSR